MDTAIVIERQKYRQKLITGVLKEQGIQVHVYGQAEDAVRKVERDAPDLILMDVGIAGLSGSGIIEKLRTLDTKVLLLLDSKPTSRQRSTYEGMDFFVAPFSRRRLAARIIEIKTNPTKRQKITGAPMFRSHPLSTHTFAELHEPITGRLDARRIAKYLDIPLSALSKCLERSVAGVHKSPSAPTVQLLLAPVARSIAILARMLGTRENVRIWMNSPHPDLDGRAPLGVILEGHATMVTEMLEAALAGQVA